jgi:phage I-like protein
MIELDGSALADSGLTWLHAMPIGRRQHPIYGELDFSPQRLQRFAANIKNRVRKIDPNIDYDHGQDTSKGNKAAGWIKDAEVRADGLWIGVTFTDAAIAEIKAGEWRYLSPEFVDEWTDAEGAKYEDVVLGAGLTNRPYLKDLVPIAASEEYISTFRPHEEDELREIAQLFVEALRKR